MSRFPPPDPADWTFDGDSFTYKNRRFPLSAEDLRVLKLLSLAGRSVPWREIAKAADLSADGKEDRLLHQRALSATSRLRKKLPHRFSLPGTFDPVLCCGRLHDLGWSITIPPDFVPPLLAPAAAVDLMEVGCISPTKLKAARIRAGLRQIDLADQVGVTGTQISQWELAKTPLYRTHADRLREVLGSYLEE